MSLENLLVELLVEELPPKALKKLNESFSQTLFTALKNHGVSTEQSVMTPYATPRRLATHITKVAKQAVDQQVSQKLMPANVGLDAQGNATPALLKKLQALGADAHVVPTLKKEHDGKTDILFLDKVQPGLTLKEGLQKALEETLAKLPIPKVMTYQLADGWDSVHFVRPAHGLVALYGQEIVPVHLLGLSAHRHTQGHRFEAKNSVITVKNADSYAEQLKTEGAVIAHYAERLDDITQQLNTAAKKENLQVIQDEDLLHEVTALVERPHVLLGQFESEFLAVPQECLILTMKANQKYFPLLDHHGTLSNKFLIVSNIHPEDTSAVVEGNERVVRPRLADAKFFFDQDRKKSLASRLPGLGKVVYHNKLGSQGERNQRVVAIAQNIAKQLGDANLIADVVQATQLTKADLTTDMVGEFPELQGIMGRYYAQHEGLSDTIAYAIEDHYKPRFAGDTLPRNLVGTVVALADKLETLVGLFSIGEKPTGDKDPFALRRQALGIIRLLIEEKLPLTLDALIEDALQQFKASTDHASVMQAIQTFCFDRLSVNLRELGASAQEVDAVLSLQPKLLHEIPQRLTAVRNFSNLAEAPALAAANKRVSNILKKTETAVIAEIKPQLLTEPAEKTLAQILNQVKPEADQLFESGNYTHSLQTLATLKTPVDAFFDQVMVNAEDVALRNNRLGLLATLHQAMNRVADLSKLAT